MKASSLKELKSEIEGISHSKLSELILRIAKYKKENKELLAYLLFDSKHEEGYISEIKELMSFEFEFINTTNSYLAKKTIRKVLRTANKHIKFSGNKKTEIEIRAHFCNLIKQSSIDYRANKSIENLYLRQIQNIKKAIQSLHEDLQYDYNQELKDLF